MSACHTASSHVDAPIAFAYDRCVDPVALGRWTLGSMGFALTSTKGVFRGTSLFDGTETYVEIVPYAELWMVDFLVGTEKEREPRVSIRLSPGALWGFDAESCLFSMTTWRAAWMDDARWGRTCQTHETEALLFKSQTETARQGSSK